METKEYQELQDKYNRLQTKLEQTNEYLADLHRDWRKSMKELFDENNALKQEYNELSMQNIEITENKQKQIGVWPFSDPVTVQLNGNQQIIIDESSNKVNKHRITEESIDPVYTYSGIRLDGPCWPIIDFQNPDTIQTMDEFNKAYKHVVWCAIWNQYHADWATQEMTKIQNMVKILSSFI